MSDILSTPFPRALRWTAAATAICLAVAATGCGEADPDRAATFPVQGTVSFQGRPVPGALVVLHPRNAEEPRVLPARGYAGPDGKFTLTTYDENDGAAPGEYAVTITLHQAVRTADGVLPGPNVLPARYESPGTTDLSVRVAEGANELPALELKR